MNKSDNYIFIINNTIEEYTDFLTFEEPSIIFWIGSLEQFYSKITTIDNKISREKLLLAVDKEFIENSLNDIIKSFSNIFSFSVPYILYLTDKMLENKEIDIIDKGENFLFFLPEIKNLNDLEFLKKNFRLYIKVIFQKLLTIERLNYYIVDSFQTIIDSALIEKQKKEIEELNKEILEISKIDYLTNILNRRAFFDVLEKERNRTLRNYERLKQEKKLTENPQMSLKEFQSLLGDHYGRFSCLLIDIDFFKKINDNYGHLVGDMVLKKIGEVLRSKKIFREQDIVARYGGEEFIVILPETNAIHAKIPAERLREYIKKIDFYDNKNNIFHITLSIGISEFSILDQSNEELIKRADDALYYAKEKGRDQIVVYEEIFQ